MVLPILLALTIQQSGPVVVYPSFGVPSMVKGLGRTELLHFEVKVQRAFDRTVVPKKPDGPEHRELQGLEFIALNGEFEAQRLLILDSRVGKFGGRYLGLVFKPADSVAFTRNYVLEAGDSILTYALRIPSSTYQLLEGDSPLVAFYRGLASFWQTLEVDDLQEYLDNRMPWIRETGGFVRTFSPDARAIYDLSRTLDPIRRLVVLWRLQRYGFREAEELLADAIYEAKDNPDLDRVRDMQGNIVRALEGGPGYYSVSSQEFQRRAEESSVDIARACFIRSIQRGGGIDKPRLARMLSNSGRKTQFEVCSWLGRLSKEPQWDIREIPYDRRDAELDRFVRHWREIYGV